MEVELARVIRIGGLFLRTTSKDLACNTSKIPTLVTEVYPKTLITVRASTSLRAMCQFMGYKKNEEVETVCQVIAKKCSYYAVPTASAASSLGDTSWEYRTWVNLIDYTKSFYTPSTT